MSLLLFDIDSLSNADRTHYCPRFLRYSFMAAVANEDRVSGNDLGDVI
jgi:hypothetical protein